MQLTLSVTSFQKGALGQGSSKSFADRGGTVGRVKDNDWVLPDPERIISSRHAVVQFKSGAFYLTDTSANGTFLNGSTDPIGNGTQVQLNDGDRLVIGDYEISVVVTGTTSGIEIPDGDARPLSSDGFDDAFDDAFDDLPRSPPVESASSSSADEPLDPLALLGGGGGGAASSVPEDIWDAGGDEDFAPSQGASLADDVPSQSQAFTPPGVSVDRIPEDWDLSADDLMPSAAPPAPAPESQPEPPPEPPPAPKPARRPQPGRPQPLPAAQDAATELGPSAPYTAPPVTPAPPERASSSAPSVPSAPASAASHNAAAAFLRGAGLPEDSLPPEQVDEFMETVGSMFRECVQDLREVLLARASLKSGFRMEQTMIRPAENNPLKFAAGGTDEAMQNLLFRRGNSYLPPMRAINEGFQDVKDHQVAMMAGMQAAFRALLDRFDPERLERRFEKSGGWSLLDVQKKSDYWSKFNEEYAVVKEQAEEDFQNLFGVDFTRAYEAQIRKLAKSRKQSDE